MNISVFLFTASAGLLVLSSVCLFFGRSVSDRGVLRTFTFANLVLACAYGMSVWNVHAMTAASLVTIGLALGALALLASGGVSDRAPRFVILGASAVGIAAEFLLGTVITDAAFKAAAIILIVAAIWLILPPASAFRRVSAALVLCCAALLFCNDDLPLLGQALFLALSFPTCLLLLGDSKAALRGGRGNTEVVPALPDFVKAAASVLAAHKSQQQPITVLLVNIDGMKQINEQFGQAFGDEALDTLTQVVRGNLRGGDMLGRHGGDAFVVLLPRVLPATGVNVAGRMREQLRDSMLPEHPDFRITISVGVTGGVPLENYTVESYIERAAKALYEAKTTGRDKVVALTMEA
ncbi:hypothetical protein FACS18949_03740 [Clostridia bacterium]|nr:hypothetical protein FACS18949_03740 [Clostridia bacterium]